MSRSEDNGGCGAGHPEQRRGDAQTLDHDHWNVAEAVGHALQRQIFERFLVSRSRGFLAA